MTSLLPDVALTERPVELVPLEWVGMQQISIPLRVDAHSSSFVHAKADLAVDLPDPSVKGIHMSRLYRLLDQFASQAVVTPASLGYLLESMVHSHADCQSRRARLGLSLDLLCRRPALLTEGLSGWKAYPVRLDGHWQNNALHLCAEVQVSYSSTCPCSAALSRQVLEQAFLAAFATEERIEAGAVAVWLRQHGSVATPHSQRSIARVRVEISPQAPALGLVELIDRIEAALGTPTQTAVKRADEQAFAQLNGQNLMYVEDAARKLAAALRPVYRSVEIDVEHQESLHPHDAVARVGKG